MKKMQWILFVLLVSQSVVAEEKFSYSGLPAVGYAEETGLQLGGLFMVFLPKQEGDLQGSNVGVAIIGSLKNQWRAVVFPDLYFGPTLHTKNTLEFRYWPTKFFGIGNHSKEADEQLFSSQSFELSGLFEKAVQRNFWVGVNYRIFGEKIKWDQDESIDLNLSGRNGGFENGYGVLLNWDRRDHHNYPRSGTQLVLSSLSFAKALGSTQDFHELRTEGKIFFPIANEAVIGLGVLGESTFGDVSFRRLPTQSGTRDLRGVLSGRYRDRNKLSSNLEFRTPLAGPMGIVVFGDISQVMPSWADVELNEFHYAPGLGFRYAFNPAEKYNVRADFSLVDGKSFGMAIDVKESF